MARRLQTVLMAQPILLDPTVRLVPPQDLLVLGGQRGLLDQ